jgi:hypothetical protein
MSRTSTYTVAGMASLLTPDRPTPPTQEVT